MNESPIKTPRFVEGVGGWIIDKELNLAVARVQIEAMTTIQASLAVKCILHGMNSVSPFWDSLEVPVKAH